MRKFRRPSSALVVAFVALFIVIGGGAWAAGGSQRHGAVARSNAKSAGPRGPRGRRGRRGARGPAGPKGATGPVGPSDGFVTRVPASTDLPAGTDTVVVQLSLTPDSSYLVTAATELGTVGGVAGLVNCTLLENENPIGGGSASLPDQNVFAQTITLTGATTGGNIKLSCNPDNSAAARNSVITAIKVGTLHTQ
ncbi:MAG TPA: hypothetical protein VGF70_04930 [Solirubrobacteraceae bacterium]|jgi:hypothetical protein